MGQVPPKAEIKSEIPRLNVVSSIPLSSEMRSHIYQKLLELDQKLPHGSALSLTLTKSRGRSTRGVEAQVEIFSPNGKMAARGFGEDLFESVSGSVASLIEEIETMRAVLQGDGRRAMIAFARRPHYLH